MFCLDFGFGDRIRWFAWPLRHKSLLNPIGQFRVEILNLTEPVLMLHIRDDCRQQIGAKRF
jgi:hypothetical protein